MYSNVVTKSIKEAVVETDEQRKQIEYNNNKIEPETIIEQVPEFQCVQNLMDLKTMTRNDLMGL